MSLVNLLPTKPHTLQNKNPHLLMPRLTENENSVQRENNLQLILCTCGTVFFMFTDSKSKTVNRKKELCKRCLSIKKGLKIELHMQYNVN